MENRQVKKMGRKGGWPFYLVSIVSLLFTVLLIVTAFYFQDEIQNVEGYGYLGIFIIGVLCGISIIPAPTLLLVFTFGNILPPLYVGLVAGLGGAIGGITVYLTGAGVETIWSRFRAKEQTYEDNPSQSYDIRRPVQSQFWSRGEAFYNRLAGWVGGQKGYWILFIVSAMIISPFYFAGLAAGSLRMGLLRFFLITWAGKTIKYLTISYAGYWGFYLILEWIEH
ncbi:hypothetical protein ACFLUJ_02825 [Chloroflexota bacterium]